MTREIQNLTDLHRDAIDDATYLLWRRPAVDISTASLLAGISPQMMYELARKTGEVLPGVPVLKVKRRYLVPTSRLREYFQCGVEPAWISQLAGQPQS